MSAAAGARAAHILSMQAIGLPGCLSRADVSTIAHETLQAAGAALRRGTPIRRIAADLPRTQVGGLAERAGARLGCTRGCAACCYQRVVVSHLELFDLAGYLRATRPAAARAALQAALLAQEDAGPGARCPLLGADNACSVYARRSLACVGYHSMDAAACQVPGGTHPYYAVQEQTALAVQAGLTLAGEAAGLEAMGLDLARGLARALADDTLEARWLRGERVFAGTDAAVQEVRGAAATGAA